MCYKGSISAEERRIEDRIKRNFKEKITYAPTFHINAFSNPNIYIVTQDEPAVINKGIWGLVPIWKQNDPEGFLSGKQYTNNARGESIFETKSFKNHVLENRCWILFDGFYEPHYVNAKDFQHYFCYLPEKDSYLERKILRIGGIYSKIEGKYYVSLITIEANSFFSEIHNKKKRMPFVLEDTISQQWIAPNQGEVDLKNLIHTGFTKDSFKAHPVSKIALNGNDNKKMIQPIDEFVQHSLF